MVGTFAAWRLGTLQARALPFARELRNHGVRSAIVTVPWDQPTEAGVRDAIRGVPLLNTRAAGVTSFPVAVAQQIRLVTELHPRAVHVFKPKGYGGLTGWMLRRRLPILVDSDDWEGDGGWNQHADYSLPQRRLFDWQERRLLRDARGVTAASHLLAKRASILRGSTDSVAWVPNGLDDGWAAQLAAARQEANGSNRSQPTIVLYSRFAEFPADWLPNYLHCLSKELEPHESVRLALVGSADYPGTGYSNVEIDQMGYVAHASIPSVLGAADIAIYPYSDTLISRSKNSVKLLELMAGGCAIVAADVGDVPAVGGDAIVVSASSDPQSFARVTLQLVRDPARRSRLQLAAQRRAMDHFSVAAVTNRLVAAYRKAGVINR